MKKSNKIGVTTSVTAYTCESLNCFYTISISLDNKLKFYEFKLLVPRFYSLKLIIIFFKALKVIFVVIFEFDQKI